MIRLTDLLKEVGEGTAKPYEYSVEFEDNMEVNYNFQTDSGLKYDLLLRQIPPSRDEHRLIISFKTQTGDYEDLTNKGEQFRIMATIVDAVKKYLVKFPKISYISFMPSKETGNDNRRANLYKAYITNQIPGADVSIKSDGKYIVKLPKK
jgi:hypothetical protein